MFYFNTRGPNYIGIDLMVRLLYVKAHFNYKYVD